MTAAPLAFPPSANDLAVEGMNLAVEHADRLVEGWSDQAYSLFANFAEHQREFMTEEARAWAAQKGLSPAPSARAWGAVTLRASREGIIVKIGYKATQNPTAHGTPATLWRSTIYKAAA